MKSIPDGKDKQWHRCLQWVTLRERGRGKVLGRETEVSAIWGQFLVHGGRKKAGKA